MPNLYTLTRPQIAAFVKDPRTVRVLERAIQQSNILLPADVATLTLLIEETATEGATAYSKAQQALDAIDAMEDAAETALLSPPKEPTQDDGLDVLLASHEAKITESLDTAISSDIRAKSNTVLLWLSTT